MGYAAQRRDGVRGHLGAICKQTATVRRRKMAQILKKRPPKGRALTGTYFRYKNTAGKLTDTAAERHTTNKLHYYLKF